MDVVVSWNDSNRSSRAAYAFGQPIKEFSSRSVLLQSSAVGQISCDKNAVDLVVWKILTDTLGIV
jgi:hypothetical protein